MSSYNSRPNAKRPYAAVRIATTADVAFGDAAIWRSAAEVGPSNRLWALDHAKYVRMLAAVVTLAQVTVL
jgi:hypothetical protein